MSLHSVDGTPPEQVSKQQKKAFTIVAFLCFLWYGGYISLTFSGSGLLFGGVFPHFYFIIPTLGVLED